MSLIYNATLYIVFVILICILSIYAYFLYSYKYWAKRKTPYLEPRFPYGNRQDLLCYTKGYALELMDLYTDIRQRGWKLGGFYGGAWPVLMVTDPEYIKDILKKNFHHFVDRGFFYQKNDPAANHLFVLDETYWKDIRTKLTPTFTSGKMKMMFPLIIKASDGLVEALNIAVDNKQDMNVKEYFAKFTTDVIVSCAFGIESNCFTDPNHQFRHIGNNSLGSDGILDSISLMFRNYAPDFSQRIGLKSVKPIVKDFFFNIISKTVSYRKKNNVQRADFLQLLINMMDETKDSESPFTFLHLVANVTLFFIAGFDTSSATLFFAFYELSKKPELQEKLRREIQNSLKATNGELTYEVINDIPYLQQVIDETLRIYPAVPLLQRRCIKEYTFKDTEVVVEKGMSVIMPIINIQRDPEYFPNPMKFDPDRFSPENKSKINQNCYLPFGDGPRNCIGLRFGLMQTKVGIIKTLNQFRFSISPSTKMPLELDTRSFLLKTTENCYLKVEKL